MIDPSLTRPRRPKDGLIYLAHLTTDHSKLKTKSGVPREWSFVHYPRVRPKRLLVDNRG